MPPRLIVFLLVTVVTCQDADTTNPKTDAADYLINYGYIPAPEVGTKPFVDLSVLKEAVKEFQTFAGLDPTGDLDNETIELMKTPRCGKEDKVANFVLQGSKWPKKYLTYKILSYPTANGISKSDVDLETKKAFNMWQDVSGLSFEEATSTSPDIKIIFAKGSHGDGIPFDGRSGVLAHAFYPQFGGDAHFDDAENWSVTPNVGNQILNTLTHEFGHSLGLKHSSVKGSIMAPFYKGWDTNLQLHQDDIKGIQKAYGRGSGESPKPRPTQRPTQPPKTTPDEPDFYDPDLCGAKLDAAVETSDGVSYVFSGDSYWKLSSNNVDGYARKISSDWPGLPDNIDAAVTWQEKKVTYFFKEDKYWRFTDRSPSPGYPKDISSWSGLPSDIDAAFAWGRSENLYFFKGSQYWKYDTRRGRMDSDYPKSIAKWENVPADIEAAFRWSNDRTYVFKSGDYWRLDDEKGAVEKSYPPYPRYAGKWWFGCPKETIIIPLTDGTDSDIPEDYDFQH